MTVKLFMFNILIYSFVLLTNCKGQDANQNAMVSESDSNNIIKSEDEWRRQLTPLQYHILREKGTERAYTGKYDNFFEEGYYVCVACEQKLFDSSSKFHSGCGWPSYSEVSSQENIKLLEDTSYGMNRIEVQCKRCSAHLGHLFNDGPAPTYLRYCINSESLRFVPADKKSVE